MNNPHNAPTTLELRFSGLWLNWAVSSLRYRRNLEIAY